MISCPATEIVELSEMVGEDEDDAILLRELASTARVYLGSFEWSESVLETYYGLGVGGIVGVFLFHIVPSQAEIDEWLWVVVGDLPPAYLVLDDAKTPVAALQAYVSEMNEWVELAKLGQTSDEVIPVNVPATPEFAAQLEGRLRMLEAVVIPKFMPTSDGD